MKPWPCWYRTFTELLKLFFKVIYLLLFEMQYYNFFMLLGYLKKSCLNPALSHISTGVWLYTIGELDWTGMERTGIDSKCPELHYNF